MRKSNLPHAARGNAAIDPRIILFSVAFLLGAAAGYFSCKATGADGELKEYVTRYAEVLTSGSAVTSASLLCAAAAYYRVPFCIYLCGLFRHALQWMCGVFLLEGFLLSFAVENFTLAMGRSGTLVSLSLLGVRAVFILPVALSVALRRAGSVGKRVGRRSAEKKSAEKSDRRRFILLYPAILALGVMAELTFVPKLAAFALRQIT